MKNLLTLILFVLIFHSIQSQSDPTALIEQGDFLDVIEMDDGTYIATTDRIFKINSDGTQKTIKIFLSYRKYLKGKFIKNGNGWDYVTSDLFDIDYIRNGNAVFHFDGLTLKENYLNFIKGDLLGEDIIGINYISDDSIHVLVKRGPYYRVRTFDIEENLKNTVELNVPKVNQFILLNDNSHYIVCDKEIFHLKDGEIKKVQSFDRYILDVSYYPESKKLDILFRGEIWSMDKDFELKPTKFYTEFDDRKPVAIYTNDSITYLVEQEDNQSYIRAFGYGINYEYKERGGIQYKDIKIIGNKYFMWGSNSCPFGNFMKIDIDGVDYQVPTINLSIDNFIVDLVSFTLHSGSQLATHDYAWSFDVTNLSDKKVDSFSIESNVLNYTVKPINIKDHDGLMIGEKRSYEGSFTIVRNQYSHPNYLFAGLRTYELDSDCSDNSASSGELLTTIKEEELFDRFLLFPNPTSDYLNVSPNESFHYKIFDSTGQLLIDQYKAGNKQIDVESLKPGLFYIQIQLENESITYNFIKI